MKLSHSIKIFFRFIGIISTTFLLSGCLLLSDIDVVQKGDETPLSDGDYIMSSFDLSASLKDSEERDFSKFSTEFEKPDIQTLLKKTEGSFLSKSYSYVISNSAIKFKKLDHSNLKEIYLAQISGSIGLGEETKKEIDNLPRYTFMFANFSDQGDLSLYVLAQDKKDFLNFFGPKSVRLEVIEQDKEFDFGVREVRGDEDSVRESVINFAETTMPNLSQPLLQFKRMCAGELTEKWNNCVGKLNEQPKGDYTEISVGPFKDGKKSGVFYRERTFPDNKTMIMSGRYTEDKFEGPWLYKLPTGGQRIVHFEKDVARKIKYKSDSLHYEGSLYESEPKMLGSMKEGFVKHVTDNGETILKIGKFSETDKGVHGQLVEGKFSQNNFSATGIRDKNGNFIIGSEHYRDTDSRYIGNFEKDKGLALGTIIDDQCEMLGRFEKKDKRDGTTTHFLTEGTTICGDAITIGTTNPFCVEENNLGGPIYFQNNSFSFWGLTNATCQKFDYGIMIENSTGKAFAVKSGENNFVKLKEVNINQIMKEHSLN